MDMKNKKNHIRQEMSDINTYIQKLVLTNPLQEPIFHLAIQALQLPPGSRGLDAGCGIGLQVLLLLEAVGSAGHVTGLDLSPEFLDYAKSIVEEAGLSEQASLQQGDVNNLPFGDDSFDWAWSANCVGYFPADPLPSLKELARVVKPGGIIAILAWSSQQLLPGYPLLEARLNATGSGIAPFVKGKRPGLHFSRALGWFREVGFEEPIVRNLTGEAYAPLSGEIRAALTSLLQMRWVGVELELTEEDRAEYKRLCQPESPDFILNIPDYYAFFTYSLFYGTVASQKK